MTLQTQTENGNVKLATVLSTIPQLKTSVQDSSTKADGSIDFDARQRDLERRETERQRATLSSARANAWSDFIRSRGARYESCRLENFNIECDEQQAALGKLRNYVANMKNNLIGGVGLMFFGPAGTGKDHLLSGMIVEAIKVGWIDPKRGSYFSSFFPSVVWQSGPQLFSKLRSGISENRSEDSVISNLSDADLLALSDFCQPGTTLSDYQQQVLYVILDRRYSRNLPTWMTINAANRDELDTMLGRQLADRLIDGALTIGCNWSSFRKPSQKGL